MRDDVVRGDRVMEVLRSSRPSSLLGRCHKSCCNIVLSFYKERKPHPGRLLLSASGATDKETQHSREVLPSECWGEESHGPRITVCYTASQEHRTDRFKRGGEAVVSRGTKSRWRREQWFIWKPECFLHWWKHILEDLEHFMILNANLRISFLGCVHPRFTWKGMNVLFSWCSLT